MLFLTGPAKSLTDAEITDAASVVQSINGVGVQGNGLQFGEAIFDATTITQQTNQALIVQQGQTETAVWLYIESSFDFETAQAYTVQTDELRLLGTFDALLLTLTSLQTLEIRSSDPYSKSVQHRGFGPAFFLLL